MAIPFCQGNAYRRLSGESEAAAAGKRLFRLVLMLVSPLVCAANPSACGLRQNPNYPDAIPNRRQVRPALMLGSRRRCGAPMVAINRGPSRWSQGTSARSVRVWWRRKEVFVSLLHQTRFCWRMKLHLFEAIALSFSRCLFDGPWRPTHHDKAGFPKKPCSIARVCIRDQGLQGEGFFHGQQRHATIFGTDMRPKEHRQVFLDLHGQNSGVGVSMSAPGLPYDTRATNQGHSFQSHQ